jgi:hypothetical protein
MRGSLPVTGAPAMSWDFRKNCAEAGLAAAIAKAPAAARTTLRNTSFTRSVPPRPRMVKAFGAPAQASFSVFRCGFGGLRRTESFCGTSRVIAVAP